MNALTMLPRLPRAVWVLQVGNVVNFFGFGLVLPFEIIYLHNVRGFATTTAGLVLATVMAVAAVVGPPAGALVDRIGGKPVLVTGSGLSALGYGALAFVHLPWQALACSAVAGAGAGCSAGAAPALISSLLAGEARAAAFALARVAVNLGIGLGSLTGGFIASTSHPRSFQALYLLDAATFVLFALLVLTLVPGPRPQEPANPAPAGGFRALVRDRPFLSLMAANVVFIAVGFTLFGNILPPYAESRTAVSERGIGLVFLVNTAFIIVAQLPIARLVFRRSRVTALVLMAAVWAVACLGVLPSAAVASRAGATGVLALAGIAFAAGECVHAAVIGPTVADLAPPHLVGRYMSVLGLSVSAGFALGPIVGSALLTASPAGLWLVAAALVGIAGAGVVRLRGRLPEHEQHVEVGS